MAIASPALPLASTAAQSFSFPNREQVKVQVRFYSDVEGTVAIAHGIGDRTLTVTNTTQMYEPGTDYVNDVVESATFNNVLAGCVGGTWYTFDLADGASQLNVAATAGANPGPANSYRIVLDVEAPVRGRPV